MEELYKSLLELLDEELRSLSSGHAYNKKTHSKMKNILLLIKYCEYVDLDPEELIKIVKNLDYEY